MNAKLVKKEKRRIQQLDAIWNNELEEAFSQLAPYYNEANSIASLGLWNKWRRQFVKNIKTKPGYQVLDVCAGTNAIGLELLQKEPNLHISAIDRNIAMQAVGTRLAKSQGFHIESIIGDAHQMPFPDNTFDIVTIEAATRHLRVAEVFAEIRRVLKPGGCFYHCDLVKPANKTIEKLYYAYMNVSLTITGLLFRAHSAVWKCKSYYIDAIRMFYTAEEISELMRGVGFLEVSYQRVTSGLAAFHKAIKP